MASALVDEAMNMIDHEDDEPHEEGTSSSSNATTSKPTSSSSSANSDDSSSLGAIFQTAYTSNSSQSSSNVSRSNPASSAPSSANISSTPYSATASGPRVSNTSDLFAPEVCIFTKSDGWFVVLEIDLFICRWTYSLKTHQANSLLMRVMKK